MKKKNKPIKIDISNINPKNIKNTKSFLQEEAFESVVDFLNKDFDLKIRKKTHINKLRIHNTIFLHGQRGSGKTQFLLHIEDYIKNKEQNTKMSRIYFFEPIDPTLLHGNESFLTIIIAKILNDLENQKDQPQLENNENKDFYKILNKLSNAIDGVIKNMYHSNSSLENIAKDQTSLKLEEYMHEFFYMVTKILDKKRLVLPIDDVDMAFDKGFEVLEVIRKYLTSPYVIPIVTGDLKLYELVVKNNFSKKLNLKLSTEKFNIIEDITKDYLIKVFPAHRRVNIKTLYKISKKRNIIFEYGKDKYYLMSRIDNLDLHLDNFYFRKLATSMFNGAETLSEEFIKNLFSNPLRNIIQFLHREYTFDKKSFSLYNTEDAQRIQKQYNLKLLDGVETWKKYYLEAKKYLSDSEKKNDAIRYLNMSLEIEEREETYLELGNVYYSDERWDEAERIYNKILYIKPNSYNAYLKLGDIFRRKEDYTKAIDFYNKSISILPTYDAYNRLGICFFHDKNGKLDTVIEQFKNAINLDKDNPKAYLNLFEIVLFEKVDEGLLKKEFKKKFHDQVHSMKIYDMLIILDKIYHGIEDKEIIILFEIWNNQYKKTSISGWSFVELEKKIDQINIPKIKDKLNDYLKKFEDNM